MAEEFETIRRVIQKKMLLLKDADSIVAGIFTIDSIQSILCCIGGAIIVFSCLSTIFRKAMKAFMDLPFTYWMSHKPRKSMFGKRAVVISTTAGMGAGRAIRPIATMLFYWRVPWIKKYAVAVQAKSWDGVSGKQKENTGKSK